MEVDRMQRSIHRQATDDDHRDATDHSSRRSLELQKPELTARDDEIRDAEDYERAGHEPRPYNVHGRDLDDCDTSKRPSAARSHHLRWGVTERHAASCIISSCA